MMNIPVRVQNLSFSYSAKPILDNISFSCTSGTFTAILGPNGSGKTTLLRNISGWLKPAPGTVFIFDKDTTLLKEKELARRIACLRQEHTGGFDTTVYDLVFLGRSPYIPYLSGPKETDRSAVADALAQTGIEHLAERNISTLSGGELQRVYIAQALAQNADILLLDEPVTHLDIKYQLEILSLIKLLQKNNTLTVIAVLHDLNLAASFSERIILLKEGTVFKDNTPQKILTPKNIGMVFGVHVRLAAHPDTGIPQIMMKYSKEALEK
ncbi:MAG: ABC transporter ATP-binding protein [Spirochaetales bacterium]|nr:ABC transporter ATP-binding protein [Spirochaetales bacterium]